MLAIMNGWSAWKIHRSALARPGRWGSVLSSVVIGRDSRSVPLWGDMGYETRLTRQTSRVTVH